MTAVAQLVDQVPVRVDGMPKVLMIGGAAYTTRFVGDLAGQISAIGRFDLASLGLGDEAAARSTLDSTIFTRQFTMPPVSARPRTVRQLTRLVPTLLRAATLRQPGWVTESGAHMRRPVRQLIGRRISVERCRSLLGHAIHEYDIYHYHSLEPARLPILWLLPPSAPVVLSVWGSDLLRSSGTIQYADQLAACNRANVITVTSIEMREILLSKFGRQLAPKVRLALLGISLLDEVDRCRDSRDEFLESVGVSPAHVTICIGNNASPGNQHLAVIDRLSRLSEQHRSRVTVLVPLSYRPAERAYKEALLLALQRGRLRYRVFDSPLSDRGVAMLRNATDILIHVPVSDAFSAAMLETLYAGGLLITGSWLPYSELRRAQVSFEPVSELEALTETVSVTLDNLSARRRAATDNQHRVRALVHPTQTVPHWVGIYDELLRINDMGAQS